LSNLEKICSKFFTLFVAAILFTGSFAANPLSFSGAYAEDLRDENGFPKPIESFHFDSSNTHSLDLINDAVVIDEDNPYLLLDGDSDYARVSLPNYDSYLDEFAISAWVKPDYSNGSPEFTIASMKNSFQLVINNLQEPEKHAKFSVYDGLKWYTVTSVVSIEEEWTHITATFADSTIKIYVNGKFAATVSDVPMPILPFVTSDDSKITVGALVPSRSDVSKTKNYFSGSIDAIQIFPLSLDSSQIEELFVKERLSDASQLVEKIIDTVNASLDVITTDQTANEFGFVATDEQNDAQEIEEEASKGFKIEKEEKKKKITTILTVITNVINYDGGSATASDFRMSVAGNDPRPESFLGDEKGVSVSLRAGSYDVSEYGPVGYTPSFSADCSSTIKLGEKKTCTVTNYDGSVIPEFGASTLVTFDSYTSTESSYTTTGDTTTGGSDVQPFDDVTIVTTSSSDVQPFDDVTIVTTSSSDVQPFDDGTTVIPGSYTSTESSYTTTGYTTTGYTTTGDTTTGDTTTGDTTTGYTTTGDTTTGDTTYFTASSTTYEADLYDYKFLKKYLKVSKDSKKTFSSLPVSSNSHGSWKLYCIVDGEMLNCTDDDGVSFTLVDTDGDGEYDAAKWNVPEGTTEFYIAAEIVVINVQSHPVVGGTWEVQFETDGTANLIITAVDGTTWNNIDDIGSIDKFAELKQLNDEINELIETLSELTFERDVLGDQFTKQNEIDSLRASIDQKRVEQQVIIDNLSHEDGALIDVYKDLTFLEVKCGDETVPSQWSGNSVIIEEYSCSEISTEISKVHTTGIHTLEFTFGTDVEYAFNDASGNVDIDVSKNKLGTGAVGIGDVVTYFSIISNLDLVTTGTNVRVTENFAGGRVDPTCPTAPVTCSGTVDPDAGVSGASWNQASGILSIAELPPGKKVTLTFTAEVVSAPSNGLVKNTQTSTVDQNDPEPSPNLFPSGQFNNSDQAAFFISEKDADLKITKDNGVTGVTPGETTVTYTIVVTNSGPSDVSNIAVTDNFPPELSGVSWSSTATGGAAGNTAASTGNISDTLSMPAGSSVTYTVSGLVRSSATGLSNTATVQVPISVNDTNTGNNSATDTDVINALADLSVTKDNGVTGVTPGETTVTYTIVVTNSGPSDVLGATFTDNLSPNLSGPSFIW